MAKSGGTFAILPFHGEISIPFSIQFLITPASCILPKRTALITLLPSNNNFLYTSLWGLIYSSSLKLPFLGLVKPIEATVSPNIVVIFSLNCPSRLAGQPAILDPAIFPEHKH